MSFIIIIHIIKKNLNYRVPTILMLVDRQPILLITNVTMYVCMSVESVS